MLTNNKERTLPAISIKTLTWLRPKKVIKAANGAANENASKCFLIRILSNPSWSKKVTNANAAGAYYKSKKFINCINLNTNFHIKQLN